VPFDNPTRLLYLCKRHCRLDGKSNILRNICTLATCGIASPILWHAQLVVHT